MAPPADDLTTYGAAVYDRLVAQDGGPALVDAAAAVQTPVHLVGGAVRDLLLGRRPAELDAVVEGDPAPVAAALADRVGGRVTEHDRFGTVSLRSAGARIDLARARAESYAHAGALPDVRPGALGDDLMRRDFTVNAIAVALNGAIPGQLHQARHGIADLDAGRLRVLHDASFRDDPTRLLRLARYAARLGFEPEEHTAELAAAAVAEGALATVSGARLGAELRLALTEPDPLAALRWMQRLGLLSGLHARLRLDEPLAARALELLPADARADLLVLAVVALPLALSAAPEPRGELRAWLDRLEFLAGDRDRVVATAGAVPALLDALSACARPSELHAAVSRLPPEAVALAGAMGPAAAARRWLDELRHVGLEISGDDLLRAGLAPGPEIGRRLAATLARRLDGELAPGRDAELRAALDA